ncbi:MAG: ABC transporter ATP-binding protein [Actinomycetota bacterium]|nr:ABC transporter ATP-binding protein [Actinomycetota bacterium]
MGGITVEHVARSFGEVHAVRDATFSVEAGHVAGLIGPNGSGKTTLLLMLATLLVPDTGSIRVAGHDPVAASREVRAHIGWMPDALGSWPSLTVRDALVTSGRMYGMTTDAASARAAELIELVDLAPLADRPTRVLSRGQKQRLSLGRALVHDPDVLLLDEPASGLDPAARAGLRELVRRLAGEGKTVLVSSHVLAELEEMADTAVYLADGVTAAADAVERAGRSERQWRIRSLDAPRLAAALDAAGFGAVARIDNLGAVVPLTNEPDAAQLLAHLVGVGVPVSSFAPAVGDLEHVFLDLNRAGPPPAASAPDPAAPIDGPAASAPGSAGATDPAATDREAGE